MKMPEKKSTTGLQEIKTDSFVLGHLSDLSMVALNGISRVNQSYRPGVFAFLSL